MLRFLGYELELFAVGRIVGRDGVSVRHGADLNGGRWLIVGLEEDADRLVWVCAPVTSRMLEEVAAGRADAWDAVCHSVTGMADVVMVDGGRAVPDRCVRSLDLNPAHPTDLVGGQLLAA
ncbi:MAG TPA: hypothetical protein VIY28_05725 [Pseudonocardiaceae bacterium]